MDCRASLAMTTPGARNDETGARNDGPCARNDGPGARSDDYRAELGIEGDAVVALYSGNMGGKQGISMFHKTGG